MPSISKQSNKPKTTPKRAGVIGRIAPIKFNPRLRMLCYGKSGRGKTTFACSFPKPLILIGIGASIADADGTKSVYDVPGVDFVMVNDPDDLPELLPHAGDNYKTVVIDHASSLQDMLLKNILGIEELPVQKSWGMASRDQYGQCGIQTKEYLRVMLNLPCDNVIILAQERNFKEESTQDTDLLFPYIGAGLAPSVVGWLNPACEYICQCFIQDRVKKITAKINGKDKVTEVKVKGKVDYCMRIGPDPIYHTKFRIPKGRELPNYIIDPSYNSVMKLISQRSLNEDTSYSLRFKHW